MGSPTTATGIQTCHALALTLRTWIRYDVRKLGSGTKAQLPRHDVCTLRHTVDEFFGSFHSFSEACLSGTGTAYRDRRTKMKHNRDLQFCNNQLRLLQRRDGLEPEQRRSLEKAQEEMKRLWRIPNPTREEVSRVVRTVAEAIIKNFIR